MRTRKVKAMPVFCLIVIFSFFSTRAVSQRVCTYIVHKKSGVSGNFLVKKDGTVIHGEKVYAAGGNMRVDGQKIDDKELKEYHRDGYYYILHKRHILRRVFAGKQFNIYANETETTNMHTGNLKTTFGCEWYIEDLETGKISLLADLSDLKKYVTACPTSVTLLDLKETELKRRVLKDKSYINDALELHENGCVSVAKQQ